MGYRLPSLIAVSSTAKFKSPSLLVMLNTIRQITRVNQFVG